MAAFFSGAGLMHFLKPGFYLAIMPSWVPRPRAVVYFTGVCEILGGLGLLVDPLRPAAAWGLILLLAAVFPANVKMFQDERRKGWTPAAGFLALRLPLQAALVWWVCRAGLSG